MLLMRAVAVATLSSCVGSAAMESNRPALLFATPSAGASGRPPWAEFVNLPYMHALHNRSSDDGGFEVDFLDSLNDMTPSRLMQYNALILFVEPGALIQLQDISKEDVPADAIMPNTTHTFLPTVRDFVQQGGGIFLFPSEQNWATQWFPQLLKLFEIVMPIETILEHNASNVYRMNHMSEFNLTWTDGVTAGHPITAGVSQVWYPSTRMFNAGQTGPLLPISSNWTVLLRGTTTTQTVAFNISDYTVAQGPAPACANVTGTYSCLGRVPGVFAPALFAVRNYGKGKVAVLNQWRQYTTANLGAWLFDDQVLNKGAGGRPSNMGCLLRNAFKWLASSSPGLGGYVTPAGRLSSPNESPATVQKFAETAYDYDVARLDGVDSANKDKIALPGIIGAYSSLSDGSGSVAEFASAAKASGLKFLVFLEPFALPNRTLTAETFAQLKADCSNHSSKDLKLIPGYWIENQFGSRMMMFGDDASLPPAVLLTDDGRRFRYQTTDPKDPRNMTGLMVPEAMSWLLTGMTASWNLGYFWLGRTAPKTAFKLYDLRTYSMAATKYYGRDGKLVEDLVEDFKLTAESTIVPTPVCVSEVGSPAALSAAVQANQALTFVRASSVDTVFDEGLRWSTQYDSLPTFVSDGPIVDAFPQNARYYCLGEAKFVVGLSLQQLNISVSAQPGGPNITSVAIYNGRELFRRFTLNAPQLFRTLLLDADLHKTLVLVVTDAGGNVALANAARSWKAGSNAVIFCGDHLNDCGHGNLLAHGPMISEVSMLPQLAQPGAATWDGGPPSSLPILKWQESRPILATAGGGGLDCFLKHGIGSGRNEICGGQDSTRCSQTPSLEYSDESVQAVHSTNDRIFSPSVEMVANPGNTWGPLGGPTPFLKSTQHFIKFDAPSVGIPVAGYAGGGVLRGSITTIFRSEIRFLQNLVIDELVVISGAREPSSMNWSLAVAPDTATLPTVINMNGFVPAAGGFNRTISVPTGGWFAAFAPHAAAAQASVFFNRGVPILLRAMAPHTGGHLFLVTVANLSSVAAGERVIVELAQFGSSLHTAVNTLADVRALVRWIDEPDGMNVLRGTRKLASKNVGLLEFVPDNKFVCEVVMGGSSDENMMSAVRVSGLNRRWTVGMYQDAGYAGYNGRPYDRWKDWQGHCASWSAGCNRYTVLGLDATNTTNVPLYVGLAPQTHVRIGHPVVASGPSAEQVFIQATHIRTANGSLLWHVAVNNPTESHLTGLRLSGSFAEVAMPEQTVSLAPGEHRVLQ